MRLFEIESSNYARDFEKHKKWIQIGQRVSNATEIGSGVDWKGNDELWNKASALGHHLTHLGQGKVQSHHDAFELAGITDQAEWDEIVELVKTAKKADFDAGDYDEQGSEEEK